MGSRTATTGKPAPARTRGRVPARSSHAAPGRSTPSRRGHPGRKGQPGVPRGLVLALVGVALAVGLATPAGVRAALDREDPLQEQVAALERAEAERDTRLAGELVDTVRQSHEALLAVVQELTELAPPGSAEPPPGLTRDDVDRLLDSTRTAAAPFDVEVSGGTQVNLARTGFAHASDLLVRSLQTYRRMVTGSAGGRAALYDVAGEVLNDALVAWSLAATQLDDLAVSHDLGHVHLYLSDDPSTGAMLPDGARTP